ncbi:VOC family protein [Streptomyces sp. NPDC006476]|uniref:VOC family protein n=1 Tax=Streptomyces sp. NPDC006476 TaxID=3157175 RepID=UPI0033A455F8
MEDRSSVERGDPGPCVSPAGWDEFKLWCDHFARQDVPVAWGPSRHGIGDALFIMFHDAAGYLIEFCAEMSPLPTLNVCGLALNCGDASRGCP